jgi:hypothetical protein
MTLDDELAISASGVVRDMPRRSRPEARRGMARERERALGAVSVM